VVREGWSEDERRSRRLLFAAELEAGTVRESDLVRAPVRDAVLARRVPARLSRAYQRRLMRRGRLTYLGVTLPAVAAARRAVLGEAAAPEEPRLLVRLGPFPGADGAALRELADRGLRYLLAVDAARPLTDDEVELLADLRRAGVVFALEGPAEELAGRSADAIGEALAAREKRLTEQAAIRPDVLVAPDNLNFRVWKPLAERYSVFASGPGSVAHMGYHGTPLWRGEAVWMPSYEPFHGDAAQVADAVRALDGAAAGAWVPAAVDATPAAARLAPWAASWDEFLEAVRRSRG